MGVFSENAIIGASAAGGYDIDYSSRWEDGDSPSLLRTVTIGSQTDAQKATFSCWFKIDAGSNFTTDETTDTYRTLVGWGHNTDNKFTIGLHDQSVNGNKVCLAIKSRDSGGSMYFNCMSHRLIRDPSAWYHLVVVLDGTQGDNANRIRAWLNGEAVTWHTYTNSQTTFYISGNSNNRASVGVSDGVGGVTKPWSGYIAEAYWIDGQALTVGDFAETDATTNEWKAIKYTGTYGNNGFYMKFADGGMITYDRTSEIAVTSSFTWAFSSSGNTDGEDLVNGLVTNNDAGGGWMPSGSVANRWVKFDFGTGKVYKACQWISINSSGSEGTWKWQGSNDDASWTDIGGTFTLGGSQGGSNTTYTLGDTLNANTTSYRYYRILGISGSANTSGRRLAMYFSENVAGLGNDSSGNGNNYTPNNIVSSDQMIDSPQNSTGSNFATLNSVRPSPDTRMTAGILSEGNLKFQGNDPNYYGNFVGTIPMTSGKWYWEVYNKDITSIGWTEARIGVLSVKSQTEFTNSWSAHDIKGTSYYMATDGKIWSGNGTGTADQATYGNTYGDNTIIGVALNMDDGQISYYKNGTVQNSGTPFSFSSMTQQNDITAGALPWVGGIYSQHIQFINFGQDSSFAGEKAAQGNQDDNGCGDFYYAPPTGYLAVCSDNLPDPSIAKPEEHFNTIFYAGTGSTNAVTGVGFAPEMVWNKSRSAVLEHHLFDTVRGATKYFSVGEADAEATDVNSLTSFDSDGFTVGSSATDNQTGGSMVSWNWKAGGTAVSNTDGTITSSVSANTTAGFSIVSYAGSGSAGATVGHGLSQTPDLIIIKNRSGITNWVVNSPRIDNPNTSTPFTKWAVKLDLDQGMSTDSTIWNNTAPSASVFTLGTAGESNRNNPDNYMAYCFHNVEGYCKVGEYNGTGTTNGPFIYTGFKPAFIMVKLTSAANGYWVMFDNKRDPDNPTDRVLYANISAISTDVSSYAPFDLLSNGFKSRIPGGNGNEASYNSSGQFYLYLAMAESPFKTSRAR